MKNIIIRLKKFFNRFNLINGWSNGSGSKQSDKYVIEFRLGKLTVIELDIDFSKHFRITLFNFAISFK
jgi:hypothetical protein